MQVSQQPVASGRQRILEAAAELFVRNGYAATSTREIARMVDIKQPSLYYHFSHKSHILNELLLGTAMPALLHARELRADESLSPRERLTRLITYDVTLLCSGQWNLGTLYLLPEVQAPEFAEFQQTRQELYKCYRQFVRDFIAAAGLADPAIPNPVDLVYYLVEGVIVRRDHRQGLDPEQTASEVCGAALRILGEPNY